jgi:uncharacterized sporulation protein YeaH/YhbH (DUF444 family)
MDLFFEDLALPNLHKTRVQMLVEEESVRAGHTHDGVPSNIDIVRSLTGALARRTALRGPLRAELIALEERLAAASDAGESGRCCAPTSRCWKSASTRCRFSTNSICVIATA